MKPSTLAMILAGGRVDELDVLTYYRPKSAVPFGGFARVIDFPLSNLLHSGIEQVAILSQYRSYSLINHIGTGAAWDMIGRNRGVSILPPVKGNSDLKASTDWYRGTADAVYKNLDFIKYHDPVEILILSGDHIYKMDYQDIISYHHQKDADLTIAFLKVSQEEAKRFGIAAIDDEDGKQGGRVTDYWEKPENPEAGWASLTVLVFKPEILYEALNKNQQADSFEFGKDIIPLLLAAGKKVYGYKYRGYWGYTRTVEEYWRSNMNLLGDNPSIDMEAWGLRTNMDHRGIRDAQPALIGSDATVQNSMVYNGCVVEGTVRNSILFPGVFVAKGAVVENSVLFFNNKIGENCSFNKVITDVNSSFAESVTIGAKDGGTNGPVTVVGWDNHVPKGMVIGEGATIYPSQEPDKWPPENVVAAGEVLK